MTLLEKIKENSPTLWNESQEFEIYDAPSRPVDVGGGVVFYVPEKWSDNAAKIGYSRYTNKALGETSMRQVISRVVLGWCSGAESEGYIDTGDEIQFQRLYEYILWNQIAAPNSPQWFNSGLAECGMWGGKSTNYVYRPERGVFQPKRQNKYPQLHACFINSLDDNLVEDGGIMDLWNRETKIFKYGSGAGCNVSALRGKGEPLSGGGTSSGVMSFLKVGNANAGAIKSGGTTRRAALMRTMNIDHPDIEEFINWKRKEEAKIAYLIEGSKRLAGGESALDPQVQARIESMQDQGIFEGEFLEMDSSWTSEAYSSVDGQNSNNSVMITDAFMAAMIADEDWELTNRTDGSVNKVVKARDLWRQICESAWICADPGVQFYDTMNEKHTAPVSGCIHATNPCSEYLYIDDTACNLASINLTSDFVNNIAENYDTGIYEIAYAMTVILDLTVSIASYPTPAHAENSYNHRTLGLGFSGLGEYLATQLVPYDSDEGRGYAVEIQKQIFNGACDASVDLAGLFGACKAFKNNSDTARGIYLEKYTGDRDLSLAEFRNMQLTNQAPTGTISFIMDCWSTGIEPLFALKTWKTLSEGGGMMIEAPFVERVKRDYTDMMFDVSLCQGMSSIPDYGISEILATANEVSPMGHLEMVAAVQEYVCGGISKTINMPNSATVEDIAAVYEWAWENDIKAVSVYRDGCKLSQPMNDASSTSKTDKTTSKTALNDSYVPSNQPEAEARKTSNRGTRERLPSKRVGYNKRLEIAGQTLYVSTGEYEDGSLGEVFVTMSKEGSTIGGMLSAFARCMSIGLQYGVPLGEFVKSFRGTKFEPSGMVYDHETIKTSNSILDLVVRDLESEYILDYNSEDVAFSNNDSSVTITELKDDGYRIWFEHDVVENSVAEVLGLGVPAKDESNGRQMKHGVDSDVYDGLANDDQAGVPEYTGEICPQCGSFRMVKSGVCSTCLECGATTGCG